RDREREDAPAASHAGGAAGQAARDRGGAEGRRDAGVEQPEPARDGHLGARRRRDGRGAGVRRTARPTARPRRREGPVKPRGVSVRRRVFAIMMAAALILLGAFSYVELGLDLMPKTDPAVVSVQTNLTGASAEEIETQLTKPVEEIVNTISGIDELRANSDQGNSRVTINFTLEREIESATQDVRDKVATIVGRFPRDTRPPQIQKMDLVAQP